MKLFIKKITLCALTLLLCIGNTFGGRKKKNATNHSSHASSSQQTSNTGTDSNLENQQALDRLLLAASIVQNQEQENNTQQNTQITPTLQNRTHPLPRKAQEKNAFLQASLRDHDLEYIENHIKSIDLKTLLSVLETLENGGAFCQDEIYLYISQYVQARNEPTLILLTSNDQDKLIQNDQNPGVNQISTQIQRNENLEACHLPSMQEFLNALEETEQEEINSSSSAESNTLITNQESLSVSKSRNLRLCLQCNKEFSTSSSLKTHIDSVHKKIKYKCPYPRCNKRFSQKGYIKIHINLKHKKIKYKCPHCPKKFSTEGNLKRHIKKFHQNLQANNN